MTSNIIGVTPDLELHLDNYHAFRKTHGMSDEMHWQERKDLQAQFLEKHPLDMHLYLLDDNQLVDNNNNSNITQDTMRFEPGDTDVGLYATKPGADDFHGNWHIRGNDALINDEHIGQVAYAHNSNKSIDQLIDNPRRQRKVTWKTKQNQQTYLHQKILSYDANTLKPSEIAERAETIREFMRFVDSAYLKKDMQVDDNSFFWS